MRSLTIVKPRLEKNHREDPPTCPPPNFLLPTMPLARSNLSSQFLAFDFRNMVLARHCSPWLPSHAAASSAAPSHAASPPAELPLGSSPKRAGAGLAGRRSDRAARCFWAIVVGWTCFFGRASDGRVSGACMHDEVRPVSGQRTSLFLKPIVNSDPECSVLFYFSISRCLVFGACGL